MKMVDILTTQTKKSFITLSTPKDYDVEDNVVSIEISNYKFNEEQLEQHISNIHCERTNDIDTVKIVNNTDIDLFIGTKYANAAGIILISDRDIGLRISSGEMGFFIISDNN